MSGRRERHAELVRDGLEAFNREDVAGILGLLDPVVESHVGAGLMNTGTWQGLEGFGEMAAAWGEAWEQNVYELVEIETPDDDHVIAHIHQRATGALSGVPVELSVFYMLEFAEDRAVRFHIYPDRDSAVAAIARPGRPDDRG
jgi:ketosteroid isomerase-like protein